MAIRNRKINSNVLSSAVTQCHPRTRRNTTDRPTEQPLFAAVTPALQDFAFGKNCSQLVGCCVKPGTGEFTFDIRAHCYIWRTHRCTLLQLEDTQVHTATSGGHTVTS
jgi:hypothetical protein